jgi:structure-specific recognition protein 1
VRHQGERRLPLLPREGLYLRAQASHLHRLRADPVGYQFSNINREDLKALEDFFKLKGLRVKNEIEEEGNLLKAALREEAMDDSEDEVVGAKADRGSADEDEESVDEDFQEESDSDVAEEFDSNHESEGSGSGSDAGEDEDEDEEVDDEVEEEEEEEERPKKKKKTG